MMPLIRRATGHRALLRSFDSLLMHVTDYTTVAAIQAEGLRPQPLGSEWSTRLLSRTGKWTYASDSWGSGVSYWTQVVSGFPLVLLGFKPRRTDRWESDHVGNAEEGMGAACNWRTSNTVTPGRIFWLSENLIWQPIATWVAPETEDDAEEMMLDLLDLDAGLNDARLYDAWARRTGAT
jgi:hypothetical protein